jgi:predicted amidohydrolase
MKARIATLSQATSFCRTAAGNLDFAAKLIERVRESRPDLICLPEAFTARGVPAATVADVAETLPGPTTDRMAELARSLGCYIVCPIYTRRGEQFWNSAVVLNRKGHIEFVYDKACPSTSTWDYTVFEGGVTPGDGQACHDFDFGRVGLQICMDANFPAGWHALAEQGARMVLWPSAVSGGLRLQSLALLHGYYVVSAVRRELARVINPCGRVVAETGPKAPYVVAEVELDFLVAREEFNRDIPSQIRERYGERVSVECYRDDALLLISPTGGGVTAKQLRHEFGIESAEQFLKRHEHAYARLRAGDAPLPQDALHGKRSP